MHRRDITPVHDDDEIPSARPRLWMIGAAVVVAAIAAAVARRRGEAVRRAVRTRFRRRAGIIVGAEPMYRQGDNGAAVLLVHGCGDTPQSLHRIADALHAAGYTVCAPLLSGHGRDLDAFSRVEAEDWYAEVAGAYEALRAAHDWVGLFGLSMGGALSARLAASDRDIPALVLASPFLSMTGFVDTAARTAGAWGRLVPAVSTSTAASIRDPAARALSLGYGAFTARALAALRATAAKGRRALADVRTPTLVIQSTRDNRVSRASTLSAFAALGARQKQIRWIQGAGHVLTVDYGWETVADLTVDWMDTHRAGKTKGRR